MKITACALRKLTYIKDNPRKWGSSHSWGTISRFKPLVQIACKERTWEIKNTRTMSLFSISVKSFTVTVNVQTIKHCNSLMFSKL